MLDAIVRETEMRASSLSGELIASVYFGGGTPSVLNDKQLSRIMRALSDNFKLKDDCEISLEANPDDINEEIIKQWSQEGINRLSIGIQSFFDDELEWMNRSHDARQAEQCIEIARKCGIEKLNADLIFGLPVSTTERWKANVEKMTQLDPGHISCYGLTVEPRTVLEHMIKKNKSDAPSEEEYEEQFLWTINKLQSEGYIHYEISNYARPGELSKHNSNYWLGEKYLGLGPSAHSYFPGERYWNVSNNSKYVKAIMKNESCWTHEVLTEKDQYNEYVMTGLRTYWGCSDEYVKSNYSSSYPVFGNAVRQMMDRNLLEKKEENYCLTQKGKLMANEVISEFFDVV